MYWSTRRGYRPPHGRSLWRRPAANLERGHATVQPPLPNALLPQPLDEVILYFSRLSQVCLLFVCSAIGTLGGRRQLLAGTRAAAVGRSLNDLASVSVVAGVAPCRERQAFRGGGQQQPACCSLSGSAGLVFQLLLKARVRSDSHLPRP